LIKNPGMMNSSLNATVMTLHLSRISRALCLQVSDRLVSGAISDPLANKNLIYWARGSLVSIGYTGLAYGLCPSNPNMPTDEWMAQTLLGTPVVRMPDGSTPVNFIPQKIENWLDIGQSIRLLANKFQQSLDKLSIRHQHQPFELVAIGFEETRRRGIHPIAFQISKPRGKASFQVESMPRDWHLAGQNYLIANPGGYLSKLEFGKFIEDKSHKSFDDWEQLLVACIRHVSMQYPKTVGPNCLSILIPPNGHVRVRFIPDTPHVAILKDENKGTEYPIPVIFSPWIIGPQGYWAPTVMMQGANYQMGSFTINIEGPAIGESTKGVLFYLGTHRRPKLFNPGSQKGYL
jgi:hypothetical protein